MSKFKQGERVCVADTEEAIRRHQAMPQYVPAPGTEGVVDMTDSLGAWVLWDERKGANRKTWVLNSDIKPAVSAKVARTKDGNGQKIIIYRVGPSVIAKDYSTGKIAEAKCSPTDQFDFHTGAKLAFDRLLALEEKKPKEKQPEYLNTKVVCVALGHGFTGCVDVHWWTVGKVYSVANGVIRDDEGDTRERVTSLEDLNRLTKGYATFIELVE